MRILGKSTILLTTTTFVRSPVFSSCYRVLVISGPLESMWSLRDRIQTPTLTTRIQSELTSIVSGQRRIPTPLIKTGVNKVSCNRSFQPTCEVCLLLTPSSRTIIIPILGTGAKGTTDTGENVREALPSGTTV